MNKHALLTASSLVLAVTASVYGQEKPHTQPGLAQPPAPPPAPKGAEAKPAAPIEGNAFENVFNAKLPEAIAKGKFNLNARLRYEYVDQDDGVDSTVMGDKITDSSHAITIRTRFGYTSAPLYGFQGMIEAEDIRVIGPKVNFNAAGTSGEPEKPIVADPPTTELNQAWLSYTYTNWVTLKGGRQRISLDNQRFVGEVNWRQNQQTFDAVTVTGTPIKDLTLYYGYVWDVHRVFGNVAGLALANKDFQSQSHLINVSYSGCPYGRFVGYAYLLDLQNEAGNTQSCVTYGGYFAGNAPINDIVSLGYRAEGAFQSDYADSAQEYQAEYYNVELGATVKWFSVGGGYEVLGTDSNGAGAGGVGFRTPLSTLHAFNGWADVFLNTPGRGLRDAYGFAQVVLPAQIPLRVIYHKFDADSGGADFGQEVDVQISKKFGKYWTALLKYAYYDGKDAAPGALSFPDVTLHKFWAQVEFNF
jgi:hypothetical protein